MQTQNDPTKTRILAQCVKDPLTHCTYLSNDDIIKLLSIIYLYIVLFELKVLPPRFLWPVAQPVIHFFCFVLEPVNLTPSALYQLSQLSC